MIRKGSQSQSTRVHSDFNQCNCYVTLLLQYIQYQSSQVVGYHPILLNLFQSYSFSIFGNRRYWFASCAPEENMNAFAKYFSEE